MVHRGGCGVTRHRDAAAPSGAMLVERLNADFFSHKLHRWPDIATVERRW